MLNSEQQMRGILGAGTNRLNIYVIQKANVGFAKYIASLPEGKERGVAIGYDNSICLTNLRLNQQKY